MALDMATPLHYAAEEGRSETVKLLLEHNAAKEPLDKKMQVSVKILTKILFSKKLFNLVQTFDTF